MNNSGSVKSKLIILIPIFIIIILLIVDTFISLLENNRFKKDTELIITEVMNRSDISFEDYEYEIKKLYELKKYSTENLVVENNSDSLYVENDNKYFGLFSSLKTYNYITNNVKFLWFNIPIIKSIKKIDKNYENVKLFGLTFKVRKGSRSLVRVTALKDYEGKIEFRYEK